MKIKILTVVFLLILAAIFGCKYGYHLAANDYAVYWPFSSAAQSWAHRKILLEKGDDELLEFIESDIRSNIPIHRIFLEDQSLLSKHIGPLSDIDHFRNGTRQERCTKRKE